MDLGRSRNVGVFMYLFIDPFDSGIHVDHREPEKLVIAFEDFVNGRVLFRGTSLTLTDTLCRGQAVNILPQEKPTTDEWGDLTWTFDLSYTKGDDDTEVRAKVSLSLTPEDGILEVIIQYEGAPVLRLPMDDTYVEANFHLFQAA